jgi:hypothetical protein
MLPSRKQSIFFPETRSISINLVSVSYWVTQNSVHCQRVENMDSKSCMFIMDYIGAEVKTLRPLSSQTSNISKKRFICVKRLHREFSCIQTTSCTRNWKPLLAGTKNVHKIKLLIWKGTISFINKSVHFGLGQLKSGEKFDVNVLWKHNVDEYNLSGNKYLFIMKKFVSDCTLCALNLKYIV